MNASLWALANMLGFPRPPEWHSRLLERFYITSGQIPAENIQQAIAYRMVNGEPTQMWGVSNAGYIRRDTHAATNRIYYEEIHDRHQRENYLLHLLPLIRNYLAALAPDPEHSRFYNPSFICAFSPTSHQR